MVERVRVGAPRFPRRQAEQAPPGGSTLTGDRSNAEEFERAPVDVEQAPPDSERAPSEPEQDES